MGEPFSRRELLRRSGLAALGSAGAYGVVESLVGRPEGATAAVLAASGEQHLLRGVKTVADNGVEVVIPPLHHQLVTARLVVGERKSELLEARRLLERALRGVERRFQPTPGGLGVTVGWGLSYFRRYLPALHDGRRYPHYLPTDVRASRAAGGRHVPALLDSIRFPSDRHDVVREQNDVCVLLRSDSLDHIRAGAHATFGDLAGVFELTSIRKGFVGGGSATRRSLPMRAGLPGAELIPDEAQLFLGFTSTQKSALGPSRIANLETLRGLTDQWPDGYFRRGTTMHVSHLDEDLVTWYGQFTYLRRVWAAFRPGLEVADGTLTVRQGAGELETESGVAEDATGQLVTGHSGSLQPATRLVGAEVDNYGKHHPAGTALIQRADFNTLDNPFFWSSRRKRDRMSPRPAAGLHFVAFAPTSDSFHRARLAMDGRYADGKSLVPDPQSEMNGLNAVIRATHRQNFLVPPRRHRSFPLAELL